MTAPKYARVAESIRAQIANGILMPGEPAPSGAALSRTTGFSALTCRKALRILIRDGVLVPGTSPNARPRVPVAATPGEQTRADAARALSKALAGHRRAAGLTQPQLAEIVGMSVTTIGHAETGRLWQSREFWEHADKAVSANGELLALHDAYRTATVPAGTAAPVKPAKTKTIASTPPTVAIAVPGPVSCVAITWPNGKVTTVYPPPAAPHHDRPTGPKRPVSSDAGRGRIGTYVRLKKRGGTYRVAEWNAMVQSYTLHYIHPDHRRGIRRVYAREDELLPVEDGHGTAPDNTEP
jgi:DNA-binding transcriptional regulator YhcF (GntR family)